MPAQLDFRSYGEGIGNATAVLRNNAAIAGLAARVPTCPGWTIRDLVTHQGVVHRWATAMISGNTPPTDTDTEAAATRAVDLLDWLDDGQVDLLNALASAPPEQTGWFFLQDSAPAVREAWARRQCHETTIHAVDAMAARLGRAPSVDEIWFDAALALDGIDELLLGFLPRRRTKLRFDHEVQIAVAPDDSEQSWTITAGPDSATARLGRDPDAAVHWAGSPVELYLGLWNRGDLRTGTGDPAVAHRYRELMRVGWK